MKRFLKTVLACALANALMHFVGRWFIRREIFTPADAARAMFGRKTL